MQRLAGGTTGAGPRQYAVSTVSLRQYDLARALQVAGSLGYDAVDLVGLRGLCEHVPVNGSARDMREDVATFRASNLRASSVNADPGSFDGFDDIDAVMARVERLLTFAAETSAPILVLPAGEKTQQRTMEPQISRMADAINSLARRASDLGVGFVSRGAVLRVAG